MTLANVTQDQAKALEQVIVNGDLSKLTAEERLAYYRKVCSSLGLNPFTKPFAYIELNKKLTLYALRDCADQLRSIQKISTTITNREVTNGVYVVTANASTPDGRTDQSIGAVPIEGLKGEGLANAYMKAETKAKRRVTLSIVGLGWLDENEVDSIPDAKVVPVDTETGELPAGQPQEAEATKSQHTQARKDLDALRESHGIDVLTVRAYIQNQYGVQSSADLTMEQLGQVSEWLVSFAADAEQTAAEEAEIEANETDAEQEALP